MSKTDKKNTSKEYKKTTTKDGGDRIEYKNCIIEETIEPTCDDITYSMMSDDVELELDNTLRKYLPVYRSSDCFLGLDNAKNFDNYDKYSRYTGHDDMRQVIDDLASEISEEVSWIEDIFESPDNDDDIFDRGSDFLDNQLFADLVYTLFQRDYYALDAAMGDYDAEKYYDILSDIRDKITNEVGIISDSIGYSHWIDVYIVYHKNSADSTRLDNLRHMLRRMLEFYHGCYNTYSIRNDDDDTTVRFVAHCDVDFKNHEDFMLGLLLDSSILR